MIVDCHTHVWQSPDQLGQLVLGDMFRHSKNRPARATLAAPILRSIPSADADHHWSQSGMVDKAIVLGFKSRYLNAALYNAGLALEAIFQLHGEAYYRRLAREVLTRFLAETDAAVLATGGGIVTDPGSFKLLQKRCRTVWLQATPEEHWRRVLEQGDVRPGAANPQAQVELRALLKAREPLYAQAEMSVDTSRAGVDGAVEEIARKLG